MPSACITRRVLILLFRQKCNFSSNMLHKNNHLCIICTFILIFELQKIAFIKQWIHFFVRVAYYLYILERCGQTIDTPAPLYSYTGELTSPDYPGFYDSDIDCYWKITVPAVLIIVNFTNFNTLPDRDYLTVSITQ